MRNIDVHIDELYLLSMLDAVSIKALLKNGIDSLVLLNEFGKKTLRDIVELKNLNFDQLKKELSRLKWL